MSSLSPPPLSLCLHPTPLLCRIIWRICVSCGKSYDTRRDQHHFNVFMNSFWFMDLCLAYGNTERHAFHSCATVFKTRDWFNITFVFLSILWLKKKIWNPTVALCQSPKCQQTFFFSAYSWNKPLAPFHLANPFGMEGGGQERERYRLAVVIIINHLWNAAMSHARLCH